MLKQYSNNRILFTSRNFLQENKTVAIDTCCLEKNIWQIHTEYTNCSIALSKYSC